MIPPPIDATLEIVQIQLGLESRRIACRHRRQSIEWEILDARSLWAVMVTTLGRDRAKAVGTVMAMGPAHLKIHALISNLHTDEIVSLANQLCDH